jgi:carboxyl-terminal processing protease
MRNALEYAGALALSLVLVVVVYLAGYYSHAYSGQFPFLRLPLPGLMSNPDQYGLVEEAQRLVEANFNGELPDTVTIQQGLVRGYIQSLDDPYTVYIDPPAAELESQSLAGEFGGIGVSLTRDDQGRVLLSPFYESPAELAGVQDGDQLVAVDDVLEVTAETAIETITSAVRGPIGEPVTITVLRDGQRLDFEIVRATIELPSVTGQLVEGHPEIGWIAISRFSDKTPAELGRAASELAAQGAQRFIIDLRNNGGGLLDSATESAGYFLADGPVLYEQSRTEAERTYTVAPVAGPLQTAPIAILVNGGTASAAEILAGALSDRGRGDLIGTRTFGKGSVQFVFTLSDGSSIHVTAKTWQTPNRQDLNGNGLTPAIEVQPVEGRDAELERAIEFLTR